MLHPSPERTKRGLEVNTIAAKTSSTDDAKPKKSRVRATVQAILRARITAGVVFVLPLWIAYLLVKFLFEAMRDTSLWVVEAYLASDIGKALVEKLGVTADQLSDQGISILKPSYQWGISIAAVLLTFVLLYLIGLFTANFLGKRIVKGFEALLDRVPLVKTVYKASKQILEAFANEEARDFRRVALIPYPSMEVRSLGFITAITRDTNTGEELCTCFLATTPNPTTGYVFVLRRADLIELDWSVENTISIIMSGGALIPPQVPFIREPKASPTSTPTAAPPLPAPGKPATS